MEHVADPTACRRFPLWARWSTALAVGLPEDAALTFASHTAAITVSRLGAMPSLPTLPEVLELIRTRSGAGLELSCLDARCAETGGSMEELFALRPGRYRHFKGNEYELLYVVPPLGDSGADGGLPASLYGERGVWVRPAAMWSEP